jgi:hypothetical protein
MEMTLIESAKRWFSALAVLLGVCVTGPSQAQDWRTLRPVDLPAALARATWSDGSYLSEGHGIQFGRMAIYMQPTATRPIRVKQAANGGDGIVIENLTCYNALMGASTCQLLLVRPRFCHLFVDVKSKIPDSEHFDLTCPADLALAD